MSTIKDLEIDKVFVNIPSVKETGKYELQLDYIEGNGNNTI